MCYSDIHVYPLYHEATTIPTGRSGWVRSAAIWTGACESEEYWWGTRPST